MPRRKLAIILAASLGAAAFADLALVLALAHDHRPFVVPLASLTGFIPGLVIATLAWRGRLPSRCAVRS